MENEKILSNEELLNTLGGSNFLSAGSENLKDLLNLHNLKGLVDKHPVEVILYAVKPIGDIILEK